MVSNFTPWYRAMIKYILWIALVSLFIMAPFIGAANLHIKELLNFHSLSATIFFDIRLPRVLFAFFAGAILALSGLLFQTLFRNALMTPYTLGVSSGAVLGTGVAIKLNLGMFIFGISMLNLFGFLGAIGTLALILWLWQFLKSSATESLLLLGIALSLFYTAALMILFYFGSALDNDMLLHFTMGSLSIIGWQNPMIVAFSMLFLLGSLYLYRHELQLLSISNESAKLKGVDTKHITIFLLSVASFAIGTLVSVAGPIGFIGLITPHIVSKLYPQVLNKRLIKTALFGGFFLVFCDTLTRAIPTQSELPIGIITALIGGPFFIYLIITKASR